MTGRGGTAGGIPLGPEVVEALFVLWRSLDGLHVRDEAFRLFKYIKEGC